MVKKIYLVVQLCVVFVVFSANVNSGITEFNQAMRSGDYPGAARETKVVWENYPKDSPKAATLAREFAFVNYLAAETDSATEFLQYFSGERQPQIKDDQPLVTHVLIALVEFQRSDSDGALSDLGKALRKRTEKEGLDNISITGMDKLYNASWIRGNWKATQDYAELAQHFYERAGEALVVRRHRAAVTSIAAKFMYKTKASVYDEMVDAHDAIVESMDKDSNSNKREELTDLKWVAHAWTLSMDTLFRSYYSQTGSLINSDIKPRTLRESKLPYFAVRAEPVDNRELCDVELFYEKLRYPSIAAFKGMVGAVLISSDFDEEGHLTDVQLLASVPHGLFSKEVMEKAPTFTLKKSDSNQENCRVAQHNRIQSFVFKIQ